MSQPIWKLLYATDYSALYVDTTGVYDPEMQIAEEIFGAPEHERFLVFRFPIERLKRVTDEDGFSYVVPYRYEPSWPYPASQYREWYLDDLASVARSVGTATEALIVALCSESPRDRAWAFEAIGGYHGYDNLDSYPLRISEHRMNAWPEWRDAEDPIHLIPTRGDTLACGIERNDALSADADIESVTCEACIEAHEAAIDERAVRATAPSAWASYLINGDDSGIDEEDRKAADEWIADIGLGAPVSCDDAGFVRYHDAYAFCPLAADCQEYLFLRDSEEG